MGKSTSSRARFIIFGLRGRHENGWKKVESQSYVEEIDEIVLSGRTDIIS